MTFLWKERNVFGRPAEGGGQPQALGQVVGNCPALTISPRDSSMGLALRGWEPAGHPPFSEGSPTAPTSPFLIHPSLRMARHEQGPLSWLCSLPEPVAEKLLS